jgi:hypothetical protein
MRSFSAALFVCACAASQLGPALFQSAQPKGQGVGLWAFANAWSEPAVFLRAPQVDLEDSRPTTGGKGQGNLTTHVLRTLGMSFAATAFQEPQITPAGVVGLVEPSPEAGVVLSRVSDLLDEPSGDQMLAFGGPLSPADFSPKHRGGPALSAAALDSIADALPKPRAIGAPMPSINSDGGGGGRRGLMPIATEFPETSNTPNGSPQNVEGPQLVPLPPALIPGVVVLGVLGAIRLVRRRA